MSPTWPRHSSFILTHASVTIWHPSTYKGPVGSSTIHQVTLRVMAAHVTDNRHRDLCPSSVPAMVAHEPSPACFSHGLGVPGKCCVRQLPMDKELFWKFRFPVEKSQNANEGTKCKSECIGGRDKRNNLILPASPLPKAAHLRVKRHCLFVACALSHRGKRVFGGHLTSLHAGCCQEGPFLSYSIQSHWFKNYVTGRQEESGRAAYKNLGEH